ncbi:hypothetical protein FHR53_000425 [Xanthomonas arboricola]
MAAAAAIRTPGRCHRRQQGQQLAVHHRDTAHSAAISIGIGRSRGARVAINQTTGPGAGTIRAMSMAELPAGEIVSPPARCACLRLQVPRHASSPRVDISSCAPLHQAPASAQCALMRPLTPPISYVEACRALCDHPVLAMRSVRRHVHTYPMTQMAWCRPAPCAHRVPTLPSSVCAATNAGPRTFRLRPRCAHASGRSPPAIQAWPAGRRSRNPECGSSRTEAMAGERIAARCNAGN